MHKVFDLSGASPSAAGTVLGAQTADLDEFDRIEAHLSLQGATGGTLTVTLQKSGDGVSWFDWFRSSSMAALAGKTTVAIAAFDGSATPVTVGTGDATTASPALAANNVAPGKAFKFVRVVFEAGVGTSGGAQQTVKIEASKATG